MNCMFLLKTWLMLLYIVGGLPWLHCNFHVTADVRNEKKKTFLRSIWFFLSGYVIVKLPWWKLLPGYDSHPILLSIRQGWLPQVATSTSFVLLRQCIGPHWLQTRFLLWAQIVNICKECWEMSLEIAQRGKNFALNSSSANHGARLQSTFFWVLLCRISSWNKRKPLSKLSWIRQLWLLHSNRTQIFTGP